MTLLSTRECVCVFSHQLIGVFGPCEVADLWAGISALQRLSCERVPEAEAAVSGASSGRQEAVLMGWPRDGLHRR